MLAFRPARMLTADVPHGRSFAPPPAIQVFAESAFVAHAFPSVVQTSLCASVLNAVVMYGALPA